MKYGIVAFPSKKIQDLANHYRKRYDTHYSQIPPHFTFIDSFTAEETELDTIVDKVSEIAKRFAPIDIHATRISTFSPVTNAIYFRIEPTEQINAIHNALVDTLQHKQKHVFTPHITIGQDLSDAEHDDIIGQLRMVGVDAKEMIDRIHLMYQLENGSWSTYDTFRLTGEE